MFNVHEMGKNTPVCRLIVHMYLQLYKCTHTDANNQMKNEIKHCVRQTLLPPMGSTQTVNVCVYSHYTSINYE